MGDCTPPRVPPYLQDDNDDGNTNGGGGWGSDDSDDDDGAGFGHARAAEAVPAADADVGSGLRRELRRADVRPAPAGGRRLPRHNWRLPWDILSVDGAAVGGAAPGASAVSWRSSRRRWCGPAVRFPAASMLVVRQSQQEPTAGPAADAGLSALLVVGAAAQPAARAPLGISGTAANRP